jgi:hypothetical protein
VQIAFNAMTASMQGNGGKDNRKAGGGGAAAGVPASNWPLEAANNICRFARSKWERLSPMVDDITCIVVPLRR